MTGSDNRWIIFVLSMAIIILIVGIIIGIIVWGSIGFFICVSISACIIYFLFYHIDIGNDDLISFVIGFGIGFVIGFFSFHITIESLINGAILGLNIGLIANGAYKSYTEILRNIRVERGVTLRYKSIIVVGIIGMLILLVDGAWASMYFADLKPVNKISNYDSNSLSELPQGGHWIGKVEKIDSYQNYNSGDDWYFVVDGKEIIVYYDFVGQVKVNDIKVGDTVVIEKKEYQYDNYLDVIKIGDVVLPFILIALMGIVLIGIPIATKGMTIIRKKKIERRKRQEDFEEEQRKRLEEYTNSVPVLLETASNMTRDAVGLFDNKRYGDAKHIWEEAIKKYDIAQQKSMAANETSMAQNIAKSIDDIRNNLIQCEIGLGHELSIEAMRLFNSGRFNDAKNQWMVARGHYSGAIQKSGNNIPIMEMIGKNLEEIENNIQNCEIALDKIKVESLNTEPREILEKSFLLKSNGQLRDARENLTKAVDKINTGFEICNQRGFNSAANLLKLLLDRIRDETSNLETMMIGGAGRIQVRPQTIVVSQPSQPNMEDSPYVKGTDPVEIKSEHELRSGYVVVKIGILNKTATALNRCELDLKYNRKILRLEKVEPESYEKERAGDKVPIGEILLGDRKTTIEFFLDPQICLGGEISAIFSCCDHRGCYHDIRMKPRKIDVICPTFSASKIDPRELSTAAMNTLFDHLAQKNGREISIFPDLALERAFDLACEVVEKWDVKRIRKGSSSMGLVAWYYGRTLRSENFPQEWEFLINVNSKVMKRTIEFVVATDSQQALTGLLSRFSEELDEIMMNKGLPRPNHNVINVIDSILYKSTIIQE